MKKYFVIFFAAVLGVLIMQGMSASAANNGKPNIDRLTAKKETVLVEWDSVKKAKDYTVYRKVKGKGYQAINRVKKTSYTDENVSYKKKYTYKVVANVSGKKVTGSEVAITPTKLKAPKIKALATSDKKVASLTFSSKKNTFYRIYRAQSSSYEKVADVKATSGLTVFKDDTKGKSYKYSVAEIRKTDDTLVIGDRLDGIRMVTAKPSLKVSFTNKDASIKISNVDSKENIIIMRSFDDKNYSTLTTTKQKNYKDEYNKTFSNTQKKEYLKFDLFLDVTNNPLSYKARVVKTSHGVKSYGPCSDVYFEIVQPTITEAPVDGVLTWSYVPHALEYEIYGGNKNKKEIDWNKIKIVEQAEGTTLSCKVPMNYTYYTVRAVAKRSGKMIYSSYDENFSIEKCQYNTSSICFIGDSITFGSPYYNEEKEIYSYPNRVSQLLGCSYYNASIPGTTTAYKTSGSHNRTVRDVIAELYAGTTPIDAKSENAKPLSEYDVIVLCLGTNDYTDDVALGTSSSHDNETFYGAYNTVMSYITKAQKQRESQGKEAPKVIFMDLFYAGRKGKNLSEKNRFVTKNNLGLTLTDYQNAIDNVAKIYSKKGLDISTYGTKQFVSSKNILSSSVDNLHLTKITYSTIGSYFSQYLYETVFADNAKTTVATPKVDTKDVVATTDGSTIGNDYKKNVPVEKTLLSNVAASKKESSSFFAFLINLFK